MTSCGAQILLKAGKRSGGPCILSPRELGVELTEEMICDVSVDFHRLKACGRQARLPLGFRPGLGSCSSSICLSVTPWCAAWHQRESA